ncbi:hypothetical protein [Eubacterium oxidoreducens]|uniref:Uncharacterized protein n=1 Tax=Eubacterium oxidoreducens TaxID=1732 RepID=A0A1G6AF54_EUBOX|nr:hypothetical protein [Eubacterium oxidoreducens]SDB07064.1 hypothetical protein SAMN02910417_00513 [Eubacterium oxidoreducens]
MDECTHNCSTCSAACNDTPDGERKPSIFQRMEAVADRADEIGEDNIINMLQDFVTAIEEEEAKEENA